MRKKSLIETNPYLKDPVKRQVGLITFVNSSSAIEGITAVLPYHSKDKKKKAITDKPSMSEKLPR